MPQQQVHRRKPTPRRAPGGMGATSPGAVVAGVAIVAVVIAAVVFSLSGLFSAPAGDGGNASDEQGLPVGPGINDEAIPEEPAGPTRASFVAVGDNLPEISIAAYADACAGEVGDGLYDYAPIYAPVKPYIEAADLAYVKQETHLGGDDIGPRGWPSFNTTDAMADAIVETGFDLVASASNHSYDWGHYGAVEHSRSVWNEKPVAFTGTATSEEEAAEIPVVERNGIAFALLDYTYGVNGFSQSDLPAYSVNFIDDARIAADVTRAHELADVVLVAMHWGTENLMEADAEQRRLAQLLADLEVDVVLGSHPHVIGPLAWVEGATGHQTLVAYSLGNFLSRHDAPGLENELEGMLSCDFVKENGEVRIENVAWTPLVNHTEEATFAVYALKDYTPELAAKHVLLSGLEDPLGQLSALTHQVIGNEFLIDE